MRIPVFQAAESRGEEKGKGLERKREEVVGLPKPLGVLLIPLQVQDVRWSLRILCFPC